MDVVYAFVESLHFFIPLIAIVVICGSIYFSRNATHQEYLHTAAKVDEKVNEASKRAKKEK